MKKFIVGLIGICIMTVGGLSTAQAEEGDSLSFWEMTSLHGTFNSSFTTNFNNPSNPPGNFGRVFDFTNNDFDLNRAELEIENTPADWVTFRLDIAFGEDVAVVDGLKNFPVGADEVGFQQAYIALTAPIGNGLTFTMGHWVTLIGAEVIESGYNWNTSRSFLFGFAIPFTHTGLLMTYPANDWFEFSLGVVNGWDTISDFNKAKTAIYQFAFSPTENLSFSVQGTAGPDSDASVGVIGNDGDWLYLVDFVLNWQITDAVAFMTNFDWANQTNFGGKTDWWGAAGYFNFDIVDWFGIAIRGEYFDDKQGFRFLAGPAKFYEGTLTFRFFPGEGTELRLEYRHDQSNTAVYTKSGGGTRKFQDTVAGEFVYNF